MRGRRFAVALAVVMLPALPGCVAEDATTTTQGTQTTRKGWDGRTGEYDVVPELVAGGSEPRRHLDLGTGRRCRSGQPGPGYRGDAWRLDGVAPQHIRDRGPARKGSCAAAIGW